MNKAEKFYADVLRILERGNNVEIRKQGTNIIVSEVKKKICSRHELA